jgi:Fe2+ transport system protein FeoA
MKAAGASPGSHADDGAARDRAKTPATLADLPVGGEAHVASVDGAGGPASRLLEMGLTPGAHVRVVRVAPLGDPIEIRVRGYFLSVRREDARRVRVAAAEPRL